jgi:hypothetical protein
MGEEAGSRIGERNASGDYVFNPSWSGRWFWPGECKIIPLKP